MNDGDFIVTAKEVSDSEQVMYFRFTNKALKMLKSGMDFEKTFVKDGKRTVMKFIHDEVYLHKMK